jgi:hypothetical protein
MTPNAPSHEPKAFVMTLLQLHPLFGDEDHTQSILLFNSIILFVSRDKQCD